MKRKILLLTTIYPAPDLKYGTSAIHYFTKEWVKMGYDVKVVHYQAVYPSVFYLLAKLFRDRIASKTGAVVFTEPEKEDKCYNMDGVTVFRFPIFKLIPHGRYTHKVIGKQIAKISRILKGEEFIPDIIIGHFSNPQLEIIYELKKIFFARTCMIMHDTGESIKKIYKTDYQKYIDSIDVWGFRSLPIKKGFEANFGIQKHSFFCYSGIPENYIAQLNNRNFIGDLKRFVYVGDFIKRKYPLALINAISKVYPTANFHITYVGNGGEATSIRLMINSLGLFENVLLCGRLPRDEVRHILDDSDCMIMISKNETFGLVYLEAMGRGCITIGSRNEGIDGIIQHGVNGFLCEAGNEGELTNVIRDINSLTPQERITISENAIATAKRMTDFDLAKHYIKAVDYK